MLKKYLSRLRVIRLSSLFAWSLILIFTITLPALAACNSDAKEFTRARAQALILESSEFKQPGTIALVTEHENVNKPFAVSKKSGAETVEEAQQRSLALFLEYFPQIAVANHLGLVGIEQIFVREQKGDNFVPSSWSFTIKVRANERGKSLWKEFGLPPNDNFIPLTKKQFGAVTGITKLAENQAKADFNWKWIPNETGKALQENTAEFKALPAEIQNSLLGKSANNYQPRTEDWSSDRNVGGLFQRYDDGWRLIRFW